MLLPDDGEDDAHPSWRLGFKGRSHAALLHAEHAACSPERDARAAAGGEAGGFDGAGGRGLESTPSGHPEPPAPYDPLGLDDPSIDLETRRFTLAREGYRVSILAFRNEQSAKDEINERFSRAHPWLDSGDGQSLTLSKIRSLKRRVLAAWWARGWELSTLALSCVLLDRLILRRLVNKANRKLAYGTCVLLAWKFNEAREDADSKKPNEGVKASDVLVELEASLGVPRKGILRAEFSVFSHLRFGLAVPPAHAAPHLERLLLFKGATALEYLGPALSADYARAASRGGEVGGEDGAWGRD